MERRVKEVADSVVISNLIYMAQEASSEEDRRMYLNYAMELMKKTKEGKRAMKYRNIIFELDGTLIDTETAVLKTWQYTLKQNRRYFELDELRPALGLTIPNTLRKLGIVADPGFGGRWMENYGKYAGEAAFFDGVEETLATLKAGGYSLGIVTSRCREEYEAFFSSFRLESRFGCIVLADETKRHKPDPEPLLKYEQKAGVLHLCGGYADGCGVRQPGGNGRKNFFLFQERCSIIRLYYDGSISGSFYCMSESQFLIRFRSDTNDQKQRRRSKLK